MRAELGGIAAPGKAPDVLVFGWPTELGVLDFSKAQRNAPRAALYLGAVLDAVRDRPVILLAHSLGAAVAMETLRMGRAVRVAVLVQGAIPATGVLTWEYEFETTFHAANVDHVRNRRPIPDPLREQGTGRGCFVAAARNANRLIITTSRKDLTLARMYSRDELYVPFACPSPHVPLARVEPAWTLPQTRAIGTPISMMHKGVLP